MPPIGQHRALFQAFIMNQLQEVVGRVFPQQEGGGSLGGLADDEAALPPETLASTHPAQQAQYLYYR